MNCHEQSHIYRPSSVQATAYMTAFYSCQNLTAHTIQYAWLMTHRMMQSYVTDIQTLFQIIQAIHQVHRSGHKWQPRHPSPPNMNKMPLRGRAKNKLTQSNVNYTQLRKCSGSKQKKRDRNVTVPQPGRRGDAGRSRPGSRQCARIPGRLDPENLTRQARHGPKTVHLTQT